MDPDFCNLKTGNTAVKMSRTAVKLSILFEDPILEENFKRYKQGRRVISDRISYTVGLASLWKFSCEAEYNTAPAQVLRYEFKHG